MSARPLEFVEVNCFVDKPVEIVLRSGGIWYGTVRFVGYTKLSATGYWVGIELPHPTGTSNGRVGDVEHFRCKAKHGQFLKLSDIETCHQCPPSMLRKEKDEFRAFQQSQRQPPPPRPMPTDLVNKMVLVERGNGARDKGIVRFHGKTAFADGVWVGVELFQPTGRNDGMVAGVTYFRCQPLHGVFVKEESVSTRIEEKLSFNPTQPPSTLLAVSANAPGGAVGGPYGDDDGGDGDGDMRVGDLDADEDYDASSPMAPLPAVDDEGVPIIDNPLRRPAHQSPPRPAPSVPVPAARPLSPAEKQEIVRALDETVKDQVERKTEAQMAELSKRNRRLQRNVIQDAAAHFSDKMRDFLKSSTRQVAEAAARGNNQNRRKGGGRKGRRGGDDDDDSDGSFGSGGSRSSSGGSGDSDTSPGRPQRRRKGGGSSKQPQPLLKQPAPFVLQPTSDSQRLFAPASYLSQGHPSVPSLAGSVAALQQLPAVQQQIQALTTVGDDVLKQKVKDHTQRVQAELAVRAVPFVRACVLACLRACVLACLRACVLACLRACVLACMAPARRGGDVRQVAVVVALALMLS
jgi:hypothetical protein